LAGEVGASRSPCSWSTAKWRAPAREGSMTAM
jgi:hypothetical protein